MASTGCAKATKRVVGYRPFMCGRTCCGGILTGGTLGTMERTASGKTVEREGSLTGCGFDSP